ncbi:unnamed protein product [Rhodiola kirilowii]
MAGGYDKVGATLTECKNFKRDLKTYIGGLDAQMIINNLSKKKDSCEGFIYDYFTHEDGTLCRLFWADTRMVSDSKVFGDIIPFNATYSTNKYNMVFVPFTGIDNHKSSVTLAAGLISKEDVESYSWLLQCFKKSVASDPIVLLTDQDPALKIAVADVFPKSRHRYCIGTSQRS